MFPEIKHFIQKRHFFCTPVGTDYTKLARQWFDIVGYYQQPAMSQVHMPL